MALNAESIPMRWPAGPLDIARGEKTKGFTPATAEVLRSWQDPASLAVVQGTPVNCLVVSWARAAGDAGQQQALKPLIEKGKQAGLEFVGLIEGEADKPAAVAAAQSAGLAAVAMEGDAPANAGIPVIPWNKAAEVRSSAKSPIVGVSDGVFPGLPQGATPQGGPTNLPWVDSNGAILLIARARGARQDGVGGLRSGAGGEAGRGGLRIGRGRFREPRGAVGDLAGRRVARGPGGQETAGRGYVEESHRHGDLLRAAQGTQDLSAERPGGGDFEFRRAQL